MIATRTAPTDLRRVIAEDAVLCGVSGAVLLVGAAPLADLVDLDGGGPLIAIGAFLIALAAALAWLRQAPTAELLRLSPISAAGDLAWAVASLVVAVAVSMNTAGRVAVVVQGLVVAGVGAAKLRARRAALRQS